MQATDQATSYMPSYTLYPKLPASCQPTDYMPSYQLHSQPKEEEKKIGEPLGVPDLDPCKDPGLDPFPLERDARSEPTELRGTTSELPSPSSP